MQNGVRKDLGVCPQSDILFPELSVSISSNLACVYVKYFADILLYKTIDHVDIRLYN